MTGHKYTDSEIDFLLTQIDFIEEKMSLPAEDEIFIAKHIGGTSYLGRIKTCPMCLFQMEIFSNPTKEKFSNHMRACEIRLERRKRDYLKDISPTSEKEKQTKKVKRKKGATIKCQI